MTDFDRSLPMMLHRTLDAIMPDYRSLFARFDLTEQQWRVLRVLWSEERITSAALSARTLLPAPSLVGIIDRLEKKGLVSRLRSVEDRRVVYVLATAKGRSLEAQVLPEVEAIQSTIQAAVTQREWAEMEAVLEKIAKAASATKHDEMASA